MSCCFYSREGVRLTRAESEKQLVACHAWPVRVESVAHRSCRDIECLPCCHVEMLSATAYKITDSEARAHISLKVDAEARFSADLYLVIDVSGSMQLPAVLKDRGSEASPLSVLDIVVHSCRTVIHCLSSEDRLGIVTYSDTAQVVLSATRMDDEGKAMAQKALETLRPDGQTNLWQGLETALDLASTKEKASLASVLLLTDGVPNVEPTGGHLKALEDYKLSKGLGCSIHTFGFGSDLDSELLDSLAKKGGGSYVFIPDAGFLGTALVNSMANTVCAAGRNLRFVLHLAGSVAHVVGYERHGDVIDMGSLQLGQSKDCGEATI